MRKGKLGVALGMLLMTTWVVALFTTLTVHSATGETSERTAAARSQEISLRLTPAEVLFDEDNLKPGDQSTRMITVENDGRRPVAYTAYARHTDGDEDLYRAFQLKVLSQDEQQLYQGSLADFTGFDSPRNLNVGASETLYFLVNLPDPLPEKKQAGEDRTVSDLCTTDLCKKLYSSDNAYQGLETRFKIVFQAEGRDAPGGGDNGGSTEPGGPDPGDGTDPGGADPGDGTEPEEPTPTEPDPGDDSKPDDGTDPDDVDEPVTEPDDDSDPGTGTGPGSDPDVKGDTGTKGPSGERLPDTATSMFTLLLIGLLLLAMGALGYWWHEREKGVRRWSMPK